MRPKSAGAPPHERIPPLDLYALGDSPMACIAPIMIPVVQGDRRYLQRVRCQKCVQCLAYRKLAWSGRLMLELQEAGNVARFLTLTYREDPGELDYRDFQLFKKRYRERHGPFRFFVVGEYGDKGGRGHWHSIIYGHPFSGATRLAMPEWGHGWVGDGEVNYNSIRYVAGYVLKKSVNIQRPITRVSNRPGLGLSWIRDMARRAGIVYQEEPIGSWPGSYRMLAGGKSRRFPLTEGGQKAFRDEFLKVGGQPPRVDDPEDQHLLNLYYSQGAAYFEEREQRVRFKLIEDGKDGLPKIQRGSI